MKLIVVKLFDDWYVIERAEHDGRVWLEPTDSGGAALRSSSRFSDADVEGTAAEMLAIAHAIDAGTSARFKRCAVMVHGSHVELWSPRNSTARGVVSLEDGTELAREIREKVVIAS